MIEYKKPRYNVHFRISTMPNGFMVLDYDATPEMGNIYEDEKHGYQMVIRDVSRAEARRVCNVLNEKDDAIIRLEEENKELKNDEKELSIDFLGYKMKLRKVLQRRYDKAKGQTLYADVFLEIAEEMGIDLE